MFQGVDGVQARADDRLHVAALRGRLPQPVLLAAACQKVFQSQTKKDTCSEMVNREFKCVPVPELGWNGEGEGRLEVSFHREVATMLQSLNKCS